MDFILNSILMFSLISSPLDKFETRAYKLYRDNTKRQREESKEIDNDDINNIIEEIDNNFTIISDLMKEKSKVSAEISSKFNLKIKNKEKLTNQQMLYFKEYNNIVKEEEKIISNHTTKIKDKKELISLENEIISTGSSLKLIYQKLKNILDSQIKVIASLYKAIFHLRMSLELL